LRARGLSLQEIADRFDISRERVRQILSSTDLARAPVDRTRRLERTRQAAVAKRREIVSLWRSGEDISGLARKVGVPVRAARLVVRESATARDDALRRAALNVRNHAFELRYDDEELIAAVREVANALGHPPTGREYAQRARALGLPGLAIIQRRLGWSNAVRAAGLKANPARGGRKAWDAGSCLGAVEAIAAGLGRPPSLREYDRLSRGEPSMPSPATIVQHFGGWAAVRLQIAGPAGRSNGKVAAARSASRP
jgi:transcriptional regulator with XRE-family HTH domain